MIISYKYKFIFVKTRKVAGSSICKILDPLLGPDDIIDGYQSHDLIGRNTEKYKNLWSGHQKALWIKRHFPQEWQEFTKFTVERNPWDKVVSGFHFYNRVNYTDVPDNMDDFLDWEDELIPSDWRWYTDKLNNIIVDRVLQYDTLEADFTQLMADLNVPYTSGQLSTLALNNFGKYSRHQFTEQQDQLVRAIFNKEIQHFGYTKPQ